MRSPSSTGSCETSYSFMRPWATSSVSSAATATTESLLVAAPDEVAQIALRRAPRRKP